MKRFLLASCAVLGSIGPAIAANVWSTTLSTTTSGWNGYSIRQEHSSISAGGDQCRVTVQAPGSGTTQALHLAIGVKSTSYNTAATPVELKFGGASGITIAAGAADVVSDWTNITVVAAQSLISVVDIGSTSGSLASALASGSYYQFGASYNVASPSGSWAASGYDVVIKKIECQSTTPPAITKVKLPPLWDALNTFDAGDIVRGSNGIEYVGVATSTGVDPTTESPPVKWSVRQFSGGLYGLATTGPGGLSPRREAVCYYGSQEISCGSYTRPDIPYAVYFNQNAWLRKAYILPDQAPPHPKLAFTPVGSGTYTVDLSTAYSPEFKLTTGIASGDGGTLSAPYALAGYYTPQAWNWVLRLSDLTQQEIEVGLADTGGNNRIYFRRTDAGSEGGWKCGRVVGGGSPTEADAGVSTHQERIWMQIAKGVDLATKSVVETRFSVGTVSGEFPPGQNVLRQRCAYTTGIPADGVQMIPYVSFKNSTNANRTLYIMSMWFDLLMP